MTENTDFAATAATNVMPQETTLAQEQPPNLFLSNLYWFGTLHTDFKFSQSAVYSASHGPAVFVVGLFAGCAK